MEFTDYFLLLLAVISIAGGLVAIRKRHTSYQYGEGGESGEAFGSRAVVLGVFWVGVGVLVLLLYVLEYFGLASLETVKNLLKFFLAGDESSLAKIKL